MAKSEQYWIDLAAAKQGEEISMRFFESRGYEIEDVSDIREYWRKDIDFIAHKEDRRIPIEVKFDGNIHYTNNILLELENQTSGHKGWFNFTQAEFLTIVSRVTQAIYIVKVEDLREFLSSHSCRSIYNTDADGSTYKSALVNIEKFAAAGYTIEIIKEAC